MTSNLEESNRTRMKSINPRSLTETLKMNIKSLLKEKVTFKNVYFHNIFRSRGTKYKKNFSIDDFGYIC